MENIQQLKKEIEKNSPENLIEHFLKTCKKCKKFKPLGVPCPKHEIEIISKVERLEAKLQTLQEVCKEIKKVIFNIGAEQSDKHLQGMEIFEREILKKFQGYENNN